MLTSVSSPTFSYHEGEEVTLTKKQGNRFVKAGVAVEIETTETETATTPQVKETATAKKGQKKNADDSKDS